jgi:polygalacturonase
MSSVREFGVRGDGRTDDTAAILHAVEKGDGQLVFPRGDYLITRPILIPLERHGRIAIMGQGGTARLIMAGPGAALHLAGTHRKTALPADVDEGVWQKERLPTVQGLEIVGAHPEADGLLLDGVMQPTVLGILIRRCRHGIRLRGRDRNVVIADCHIYDNSGIGIFFDRVNLHQTNLSGNHVSYCRQGGIRVQGSEVRNLQICGNDIEYNHDEKAETSADILFDCREGTLREGTLVGNTIQAVPTRGGANVRLLGVGRDNPNAVGLLAITGNLIGSQEAALHLVACRGVVVSGNSLYSGRRYALLAERAEHLVLAGNSIDHNPEYRGVSSDRVVLRGCRNVTASGLLHQHARPADGDDPASWEVRDCENVSITGCQILGARVRGLAVHNSSVVRLADSTIRGAARGPSDAGAYRMAVEVDAGSKHVLVVNNFLGKGSEGELQLPREAGTASGNIAL